MRNKSCNEEYKWFILYSSRAILTLFHLKNTLADIRAETCVYPRTKSAFVFLASRVLLYK